MATMGGGWGLAGKKVVGLPVTTVPTPPVDNRQKKQPAVPLQPGPVSPPRDLPPVRQATASESLITIMPVDAPASPFKTVISANDVIPTPPIATTGAQPVAVVPSQEFLTGGGLPVSLPSAPQTITTSAPVGSGGDIAISPVEMAGGQAVAAPTKGGIGAALAGGGVGFLVGGPPGAAVGALIALFLGEEVVIRRESAFGAAGVSVPSTFIPITLPDGRVLTNPSIKSGLEVMARGFEAQGKTVEAAGVRAMDAQGGLAKIPTETVATPAVSAAPAGGGLATPLALAVGGFFVGGPIGAAAGGIAGFLLGRK